MEEQQSGKRSWALPIALIVIVFSLMGNVLLLTINIGHTQRASVESGRNIFEAFEAGQSEVATMSRYVLELEGMAEGSPDSARLAAGYVADAVIRNGQNLQFLMSEAERLEKSGFAGAAEAASAYLEQFLRQTLLDINNGSGVWTEGERAGLASITASLEALEEAFDDFHYPIGGNQSALIRLSGGHDWLHIASDVSDTLKVYSGSTKAGNE